MDVRITLATVLVVGAGVWAMGVYLRWLHRRSVDPMQFPNKELAGQVRQMRIVVIDCGPDEALLVARDAVLTLEKCKLVGMAGRKFEARIGLNRRTFGDIIEVSAEAAGAGKSRLSIESRPRMARTIADQGKNYENVERVFAFLGRRHVVSLSGASASANA